MYLTSWNETGYIYDKKSKLPKEKIIKKCWKGYNFNILNELTEKGYLYSGKHKINL